MIAVSRDIYNEMQEMDLIKVETIKERGRTIVISKNFKVVNQKKNSRAKTYYIEEPTINQYYKLKGREE